MARADRRRAQRAKPVAASSRYESAYVGTEGLFFQRLRAHAKWAYVFLALSFAIGFVAFGVGSDVQGGIADVIGLGGNQTGQPSVDDARDKLNDNPNDLEAMRDLARAYQTEGKPEEAIAPLEQYTAQRPQDEDALRELAGLYLTKASRLRQEVQLAQFEAQSLNPGADFLPPSTSPFGQAFGSPPISQAVSGEASERVNQAYSELTSTYTQAKSTYQKIATIAPEDASVQLQLADSAINSGDTTSALRAYKRFVALAPDDPQTPLVRQEIKRLESAPPLGGATAG